MFDKTYNNNGFCIFILLREIAQHFKTDLKFQGKAIYLFDVFNQFHQINVHFDHFSPPKCSFGASTMEQRDQCLHVAHCSHLSFF